MYRYVLKYRVLDGKMHKLKFMTQAECYLFIRMLLDEQVSFIQVKEISDAAI